MVKIKIKNYNICDNRKGEIGVVVRKMLNFGSVGKGGVVRPDFRLFFVISNLLLLRIFSGGK